MFLRTILMLTAMPAAVAFVPGAGRAMRAARPTHRFRLSQLLCLEEGWAAVSISKNTAAADGLRSITIDVDAPLLTDFNTPGQYVQLSPDEESAKSGWGGSDFFAIASPPSAGTASSAEFLIKETDKNGWITAAASGTKVFMSPAGGKGYNLDAVSSCSSSYLFATGSGIAPLRSVIESGKLSGDCTLYYGARTEAAMAYTEKFAEWEKAGVKCVPVLSQPAAGWGGASGYVQDALESNGGAADGSAALLCGVKGMTEAVKEVFPEDKIFFNF